MSSVAKVPIAMVGAGIWTRDQHLPAILQNPSVSLVAIYSRSESSATKLASTLPFPVDIYYDDPPTSEKNFNSLLARTDVVAMITCLPILTQLDFVKRILLAGKHVQSEKPIAGDVATASKFISWYRSTQQSGEISRSQVWAVGEEFRLMESFNYMRAQVASLGRILTFQCQGYGLLSEDNKFYDTAWRRVPGYQGGFLLDGGVHWTAALRHVLGPEPENQVKWASATSVLLRSHLAPVDTIHAVLTLESGVGGLFGYSAGIANKEGSGIDIEVVCEDGRVKFSMESGKGKVSLVKTSDTESGKAVENVKQFDSSLNTKYEVETFVKSISSGTEEEEETPEAALKDLQILQAMLKSAENSGAPQLISETI